MASASSGPDGGADFATMAEAIAERWLAERDTRMEPREAEAARAFLERYGLPARARDDGSFLVGDRAVTPARLFVVAYRALTAGRRFGWIHRGPPRRACPPDPSGASAFSTYRTGRRIP